MKGLEQNFGGDTRGPDHLQTRGGYGSAGSAGSSGTSPSDPEQERTDEALESLDQHFDVFDNPGGGNTDGVVSLDDLRDVATGEFDQDKARERLLEAGVKDTDVDKVLERLSEDAGHLLEQEDLLSELDIANDTGDREDGKISRSDLTSYLFERDSERFQGGDRSDFGQNRDGIGTDEYHLPHEDHNFVTDHSEENRTPRLAAEQEGAILESIAEGGEVEFTNSNGDTETLSVEQVTNTGGNVEFELKGEDGHTLRISSELDSEETRIALARIADYYTQVPEHLRHSVDEIALLSGGKDGRDDVAADFRSNGDKVRFYNGLQNLNESVFDHEFAHGIGYETDGKGEGVLDKLNPFSGGGSGSPTGWEQAIEADGEERLTEYAGTNHKEDFAESWAVYMEAREHGEEALADFRELYPNRFDILEQIFEAA